MKKARFLAPLLVLTAFFVALSWRNAQLSMDESEVWQAIPAWYLESAPASRVMFSAPPFIKNGATVVATESRAVNSRQNPLKSDLFNDLRARYPQIQFINPSKPDSHHTRYFTFGKVNFKSRFSATCEFSSSVRVASQVQCGTGRGILVLARSPLVWNAGWRVIEAKIMSVDAN